MARYPEIDWVPVTQFNRTSEYHHGDTSWSGQKPRTSNVNTSAGQLLTHVVTTASIFNDVVTQWSQFAAGYGGADRQTVLSALATTAQEIEAFQAAAKLFHDAVVAYDESVQTALDTKSDYDTWAVDWARRYQAVESRPKDLTELPQPGESGTAGKDTEELRIELESERQWNEPTGLAIGDHIAEARAVLTSAIKDIDLEDLAELRFTVHTAGLDSMDSVEEIEFSLLNNALFGDRLTTADARRIAEQIDIDSLPYSYIDANGVKWVRLQTGEMVVVGSAMDPNMQMRVLETLEADPYTDIVEFSPEAPADIRGAATSGAGYGADLVVSLVDVVDGNGLSGGGIVLRTAAGAVMIGATLLTWGDAGNEHAYAMNSSHVLLTTDQKDEIAQWAMDREVAITGVSTAAGVVTGVVLTFIPGVGWVTNTVGSAVASEAVSAVMQQQWDNTQSETAIINLASQDGGMPDEFDQDEYERLIEERSRREGTQGGGRPYQESIE